MGRQLVAEGVGNYYFMTNQTARADAEFSLSTSEFFDNHEYSPVALKYSN
jgi:hypothetical protein